ncbi:hypothetical protein TTHERM_000497498 (macronuclear) [Tetrahymena thermophila SB210]|uniref:Uncharacterized protein n=1 Tax=Tetrahymena thermophila (strain SB210) TaxID=312017 RepID=W7XBA2_TETTS|nr:hypothetical protein TTHERM_000497498 [Tetrahymena thermophila SB210]EWS70951.1 hypothetical protein TTHERM_000497498 [Tetrahymena thermophila SB210]|eukprot:XP_012656507.1 hypothetical protein TTHERM_000497498 [Tetrahymena thermophila SB210]
MELSGQSDLVKEPFQTVFDLQNKQLQQCRQELNQIYLNQHYYITSKQSLSLMKQQIQNNHITSIQPKRAFSSYYGQLYPQLISLDQRQQLKNNQTFSGVINPSTLLIKTYNHHYLKRQKNQQLNEAQQSIKFLLYLELKVKRQDV